MQVVCTRSTVHSSHLRGVLTYAPFRNPPPPPPPSGTSAWNSTVVGHKRWVLFHPDTPGDWIQLPAADPRAESLGAAGWFAFVYPRIKEESTGPQWKEEWKPVECLQCPGETVVVPSGWWHVVLNLDLTVAVTQNFAGRSKSP